MLFPQQTDHLSVLSEEAFRCRGIVGRQPRSPTVVVVPGVRWWGVVSSVVAPVLLVVGWTVAAGLQPRSFNAVTDTISSLAAEGAADQWVMTLALLVVGACDVITGLALRPAASPGRLGLVAAGVAGMRSGGEPRACRVRRLAAAYVLGRGRLHRPGGLAGWWAEGWAVGAVRTAAGCFGQRLRGAARPPCVVGRGGDHCERTDRPGGAGRGRGPGAMAASSGPNLLLEPGSRPDVAVDLTRR